MTQERWRRINDLLESALDRAPGERGPMLDRACAGDPALRREIEALLAADEQAGEFLERPAMEATGAPDDSLIGLRIGAYRIVREIGRGGMGVVYLAERADGQFEKQVAIKLVQGGMDWDVTSRRFRSEKQILAGLDHPNIAKLLDAGTTDEGMSYFVMEYVEGLPIDAYCNAHRLTAPERIKLFRLVCAAVQYAHARNVIHRDLKPGNVLVTTEGVPKLLDFGIAKMLTPEASDTGADLTMPGLRPMTPAYASPEQVRGEPVSEASDVYAMGVLLYELLTDRRPNRAGGQEPEKPGLDGDLDHIVMKALRKEPSQRYASVAEFSEDLRRYLEGFPVLARPATLGYRIAKFVRRNRIAVASAVAGVILAIAAVFPMISRDRDLTARPIRSLAVLPLGNLSGDPEQEYFAAGMTEALISDLARIRALRVISRTSTMQYKDTKKTVPEIARELKVDAVVEGSVQQSGERVRITAQLIEAATDRHLWSQSYERDFRDILALQSEVARAVAREIQVTVTSQEETRLANTRPVDPEAHRLYLWGRHHFNMRTNEGLTNAIRYCERAIEKDPTYAPPYAVVAGAHMQSTATVYDMLPSRDAVSKARVAALKAVELDDNLPGAHLALGQVLMMADWNWAGAGQEYRRAIELNPSQATARIGYSQYLTQMGRLDEALAEVKRAVELDPLNWMHYSNLARTYYLARRFDDALAQIRTLLELNPNYGRAALQRGYIFAARGLYREAIREYEKFAASPQGGSTFASAVIGNARARSGDVRGALRLLDEINANARQRYVPSYHRALIYAGLGNNDQAFAWLEKSYEAREPYCLNLKIEPLLDSLRSDRRLTDLIRRVGLP